MLAGIAQNPMHLAESPALPRTPHADLMAKLVTGKPDAEAPPVYRRIQTRSHPDMDPMVEIKSRPTVLMQAMTMILNVMKSVSTPLQLTFDMTS